MVTLTEGKIYGRAEGGAAPFAWMGMALVEI
jgi:hypothetical protein